MKKIELKKIPFKTKIRWFFLGKWPLERKTLPKIQEYLYLIFNNIIVFLLEIGFIYFAFSLKVNQEQSYTQIFIEGIQQNIWLKIIISGLFTTWIINILLVAHTYYILSKTEINKWIPIVGSFFALTFILSPVSIVLFSGAYSKNEIAFE
ncbi:hypothetical protein [Mycoplasma buteonis]|uniref:hypothetical protein n=1 Tax=Mycoplasma buteonis TaxID=171280 RepID=UPI00055B3A1A|nr:hypothetical protein [Mycoplasma buteonis]